MVCVVLWLAGAMRDHAEFKYPIHNVHRHQMAPLSNRKKHSLVSISSRHRLTAHYLSDRHFRPWGHFMINYRLYVQCNCYKIKICFVYFRDKSWIFLLISDIHLYLNLYSYYWINKNLTKHHIYKIGFIATFLCLVKLSQKTYTMHAYYICLHLVHKAEA